MGETVGGDGVFKRRRQGLLSDNGVECRRTVLSGRYDILFHKILSGAER